MARVYTCTRRERERERNKGVSVGGQQLDTGLGSMHTESLSLSPTPPALFQPLHPSRGSCTLRIVEPCFSPLPLATHRYRRRGRRGRRGFFSSIFFLIVSLPLYEAPPPPSSSSSRSGDQLGRRIEWNGKFKGRGGEARCFLSGRKGDGSVADGQGR